MIFHMRKLSCNVVKLFVQDHAKCRKKPTLVKLHGLHLSLLCHIIFQYEFFFILFSIELSKSLHIKFEGSSEVQKGQSHVSFMISALAQDPQYSYTLVRGKKGVNFHKGNPNSLYIMKNHGVLTIRATLSTGQEMIILSW